MPNNRTLSGGGKFNPKKVKGLALWLDGADTSRMYTSDAGEVVIPPGWSPSNISLNIVGWWAADTYPAGLIQLDGSGNVMGVDDLSGMYSDATQTTPAARPQLIPNVLNGKPVFRFNGSTGLTGTFGSIPLEAERTVFAVCKISASLTNQRVFSVSSANGTADYATGQSIPVLANAGSLTQLSSYGSLASRSPVGDFSQFAVFTNTTTSGLITNYSNGLAGATESVTTNLDGYYFGIGCAAHDQTAKFTGDIAEIIAVEGVCPPAERAMVEKWLADKWSISGVHRSAAQEIAAVNAPTELSGCVVWLDASDSSTLFQDGSATTPASLANDPIGCWKDKSGNSRDYKASSTARPLLAIAKHNGKNSIYFDGSDDVLTTVGISNASVMDATGACAWVVYEPNNDTDYAVLKFANGSAGYERYGPTGTCYHAYFRTAADRFPALSPAPPTSGLTLLTSSASVASDAQVLRINGTTTITQPCATAFATWRALTSQVWGVGQDTPILNGWVSEVIVLGRAATAVEVARVEKYLAQKYGIANVPDPTPPVGYWGDKSGNGRHAVRSIGSRRPSVSATAQNGKKTIAFTSASFTGMTAPGGQAMKDGATFCGAYFSGGVNFSMLLNVGNAANGQRWDIGSGFTRANLSYYPSTLNPQASMQNVTCILTGVFNKAANTVALRMNGAEIATGTASPALAAYASDVIGIGMSNLDNEQHLQGRVFELAAYNQPLLPAKARRLEQYLAARWGIALAPQVSNLDAQNWVNRVYQQGGSVSPATAQAVNQFCTSITDAGIRDRFLRLNLFAGSFQGAFVPLYRTWKVYAERNLLSSGDNFSASAWTKLGVTVSQSTSERPFDGPYAYAITAIAGTGVTPYVTNGANNYGYGTVTYSAYLKANGQNYVRILIVGSSGQTFPGGGGVAYANIDLSTGAIFNVLAGTTATATNVGNGWWRLAYTVTNNGVGNTGVRFDIGTANPYNATGTESVLFWGVQSEVGSVATDFDPYPLGNATDTNLGSPAFLVGDYNETSGLQGNGSSKYLNTGVPMNFANLRDYHLSSYVSSVTSGNAGLIGADTLGDGVSPRFFQALVSFASATRIWVWYNYGNTGNQSDNSSNSYAPGLLTGVGSQTANNLYSGASSVASSAVQADQTGNRTLPVFVFAYNLNGSASNYANARLGGYSLGLTMTATQVGQYNTALAAFNSAMGRA